MNKITRSLMDIVNKIKRCKIRYFVLTFQKHLLGKNILKKFLSKIIKNIKKSLRE